MRTIAAVLTASLLLTACSSGGAEEPSPSPTPTESPSPSASPTPPSVFPLTGMPADDPLEDQPVVSVKIENTPAARPLAGIEAADLVYEQIVEGGVTRFAALFHSQLPDEVGPIRSGRLVDVPLLEPWSSVMVYSGARDDVTQALRRANHIGLVADPGTGPVFSRAPDRPGSHDLMAALPLALDQGRDLVDVGPVPATALSFDDDAPVGGVAAEEFTVPLTPSARAGWEWDDGAQVYRRLQNGAPLEVTGDGRIGAATVVLIVTDITTGGCCDTAGNAFTVTRLVDGSGDAVVWRDGHRFEAQWRKGDVGTHLKLLTPDGEPFPMAPGPSWWQLAAADAVPPAPTDDDT